MGSREDNLRRWWWVVASVVGLVLAGAGGIAYDLISELRGAHERAIHERAEALRNADAVGIATYKRASNARGYLLSGDATFLEARNEARAEVARRMPQLLAADDAQGRDAAQAAARLIARHDVVSDRALALYASSPDQARADWDDHARPLQAQIEDRITTVVASHRARFDESRRAADAASTNAIRLLVALLVAVGLVVLTLAYAFMRAIRSLVARIEAEQQQVTFRLIEQVPVGIFVITPDGKPYYANQHAKKLLGRGVERGDSLAESYRAFEAGTNTPYPEQRLPIVRALAGEVSEITDLEVHRDDQIIPLHVVGAPVHDARGDLMYAVAGFQDVRELQRVAMRDALTGLANRAAVIQMCAREQLVAQRARRPLSLALIDLDRFKSINDTHGHAAGDDVLRKTAAALVATFRRTDIVGRWGGEELVVVMPDCDLVAATHVVDRALDATRALLFHGKDGERFSVTFSAGVITLGADEKLDQATARADLLLYAAKQAGRNRVLSSAVAAQAAGS